MPAFGASLAKNNAVKEKPAWFQHFLSSPVDACQLVWSRWPKSEAATQVTQLRLKGIDGLNEEG